MTRRVGAGIRVGAEGAGGVVVGVAGGPLVPGGQKRRDALHFRQRDLSAGVVAVVVAVVIERRGWRVVGLGSRRGRGLGQARPHPGVEVLAGGGGGGGGGCGG